MIKWLVKLLLGERLKQIAISPTDFSGGIVRTQELAQYIDDTLEQLKNANSQEKRNVILAKFFVSAAEDVDELMQWMEMRQSNDWDDIYLERVIDNVFQ